MSNLVYKTRSLYPDELRLLKVLKSQTEKKKIKVKPYYFLVAAISGACLTYIVSILPGSFWTFLLGTLAVIMFSFIVFAPYEIYKQRRRQKVFLQQVNHLLKKGTVDTCLLNAEKIAIAPEYEDESDLYIVKLTEDTVLYIWDTEYNLNKKFPCLDFEIYEDSFYKLIGRRLYPLSDKIKPVEIGKKAKWNYMERYGTPEQLKTDTTNFDELLKKYNSCA